MSWMNRLIGTPAWWMQVILLFCCDEHYMQSQWAAGSAVKRFNVFIFWLDSHARLCNLMSCMICSLGAAVDLLSCVCVLLHKIKSCSGVTEINPCTSCCPRRPGETHLPTQRLMCLSVRQQTWEQFNVCKIKPACCSDSFTISWKHETDKKSSVTCDITHICDPWAVNAPQEAHSRGQDTREEHVTALLEEEKSDLESIIRKTLNDDGVCVRVTKRNQLVSKTSTAIHLDYSR